jgi:hypothetical protein
MPLKRSLWGILPLVKNSPNILREYKQFLLLGESITTTFGARIVVLGL